MNRFSVNDIENHVYNRFTAARRKPVIGITGNYGEQNCKLAEGYYKQVVSAGGVPFIIPPHADEATLLATLDRIDGLLLSGGADINPLYCGEEPQPSLGGINAERDLPELLLTRLAVRRHIPVLGICRGIQTIACALGGKISQDINNPAQEKRIKHSQEADRSVPTHSVTINPDTILFDLYQETALPRQPEEVGERIFVNSFHHQAVSEPGPQLRVSAVAPDGIIEGIESIDARKPIIGVQWHPECMAEADGQPLFRWLTEAAADYHRLQRLHDRILTLDTHCDTPMFFPQGINFAQGDNRILVDLPKMAEGRLDATIMVAYLPQQWDKQPMSPREYTDHIFDEINEIVSKNIDSIAFARTPGELWFNKRHDRKSIMLGIENGLALEGRLDNLKHFADRGIVYMTLCHNGDNDICDAAVGSTQTHGGVSAFGADVIREMNRLGIMVDLSHGGERSFFDALDISASPIVCSHSSCRALCDHPRNLTDEQLRALAAKGGVCQVTLYAGFLCGNPSEATIADALRHIDHAVSVMGIDHVGLGTDFDGDGGVPGLADASELTNYTRELLRRRYSDNDIQLLWGGNFLRVMKKVQQKET